MEKKKCCLKCALLWRKHKCEHDKEQKKANGCFWERIKEYAVVFEEIIFKTINVKPHERVYRQLLDYFYLLCFVLGYSYQLLILYVFFFFGNIQAEWFKFVPFVASLKRSEIWMELIIPLFTDSEVVAIYLVIVSIYSVYNKKFKEKFQNGNGNGDHGKETGAGKQNGENQIILKKRSGTGIMFGWFAVFAAIILSAFLLGYKLKWHSAFRPAFLIVVWSTLLYIKTKTDIVEKLLVSEKNSPPLESKDKKLKK